MVCKNRVDVSISSEAVEKMKRAIEDDPFSVFSHAMLALIFYMGQQFDKAITQSYKALELDPNNPTALVALAMSHAARGMYDKGIKIL